MNATPVAPCVHKWELIHDWIGDKNVINGTLRFSYWLCRRCDEQTQEQPDGWDDRDGPEELDSLLENIAERDR